MGDSRHGNNFKCLTNHGYLSVKLVQTERNKIYDMVYNLLKLVLLLLVATTSVERVINFSEN